MDTDGEKGLQDYGTCDFVVCGLCVSVSICVKVVKTLINKGFLYALDGHCQWICQFWADKNTIRHNSLKLAPNSLTSRDSLAA